MSLALSHAIILAAGLGKRMRPLTLELPKPLVPLLNKPLIEYNLQWLQAAGIHQVVVNTSYLAEKLEAYLSGHPHMQLTISREEPEPLETGGGIAKALPILGDSPFVSMNSDAIFPFIANPHPLRRMIDAWDDAYMDFLMLFVPKRRAYGLHGKADFLRLETGEVKRASVETPAEYVFTGVEIIHPRVFNNHPDGAFSLRTLWEKSLDSQGVYRRVHSLVIDEDWLHVGDIEGLEIATEYLQQRKPAI